MHQNIENDAPVTTKLRRITISLPEDLDTALSALSKAQKKPIAKLITETLAEFSPTFHHMAELIIQVNSGHLEEAKKAAKGYIADAMVTVLDSTSTINQVGPKGKTK